MLNRIMQVLNEQEEIKEKIAKQVPVIARKSTREKPQKRKRTGFLGLFGKKEEAFVPFQHTSLIKRSLTDWETRNSFEISTFIVEYQK